MGQPSNHQCHRCKRPLEHAESIKVEVDGHIGYICSMCHYIFVKQEKQEEFKHMIRQQGYEQSTVEMKEIHQLLSILLTVGTVFCIIIATAMVLKVTHFLPSVDVYLTTFFNYITNIDFINVKQPN